MRVRLSEMTSKDLLKGVDSKTLERSKKLRSIYVKLSPSGDVIYRTTSGTIKNKYWEQIIRFGDSFKKVKELFKGDRKVSSSDVLNLILSGDIKLHCNDPSWKYWGWQYIGTQLGYALRPENRAPMIRNPRMRGSLCKHLISVLSQLPKDLEKISRDMAKAGRK